MVSDTDIAYLAGLIDGEGYIGIKKLKPTNRRRSPSYQARIQVRMVEEAAIAFLAETLGGSYYLESAHAANGRPLFCYQASDAKAERVLRTVLPYLRVKRENAETVIAFRKWQAGQRKHRTKVTGYRDFRHWTGKPVRIPNLALSDEYLFECERLYLRCKVLNRTGV